jgi:excisionase family DNA binding protein
MPEEAHQLAPETSPDTTGLDDFFSSDDKTGQNVLTLEEAAERLNLSPRTVQRRLKHGQIKGFKVSGPRGPEWRIEISSTDVMTGEGSPSSDDTTVSSEDRTVIHAVSSEDTTSDKPGLPESAYGQFFGFYQDQIETLQERLEAATYRNGYLEAQLSGAETQLKLLPDLSARATKAELLEKEIDTLKAELSLQKRTWVQRFNSWFFGRNHNKTS